MPRVRHMWDVRRRGPEEKDVPLQVLRRQQMRVHARAGVPPVRLQASHTGAHVHECCTATLVQLIHNVTKKQPQTRKVEKSKSGKIEK